ncbi:MAG: hypothetical protein M1832_006327 [Thelocarpon impressellum]|nr:MAG: hypothetical protein M1832_006327 [Thelocarpon impressellum]
MVYPSSLLSCFALLSVTAVAAPCAPEPKPALEAQVIKDVTKPEAQEYGTGGAGAMPAPAYQTQYAAPVAPAKSKALYLLTNEAPNNLVSIKINNDGTLSPGSTVSAGGDGATGIDIMTGLPADTDVLFNQSPVAVINDTVLVVNAGSNTVAMFRIDPQDATRVTMVGQPVDTLGDTPNSIAASAALQMACVANSGARSGVACFGVTADGLQPLDTAQRPIPLGAGQTTPPVGPFNTISQVLFNADSTALITMVKGDMPPPPNSTVMGAKTNTGFVSVFPVTGGAVATADVRTSPPGTAVLFGSANVPGTSRLVVTDAAFGAAIMDVSAAGTASLLAKTALPDQKATCWTTISPATGTAFVSDVALNRLTEIDPASGAILGALDAPNANPGMTELRAQGNFVYALAPGKGIGAGNATAMVAVFDVSGGSGAVKAVQNFATGAGGKTVGLGVSA